MATGTAIASIGLAGYKMVSSGIQAKKDRESIENFNRQGLVNPFEGATVSRLKSEQQTESNIVNYASTLKLLKEGGSRAVFGNLGRLNATTLKLQDTISSDLEVQDLNNKRDVAIGEEHIRDIREMRENSALAGLGQSLQVARQDFYTGAENVISGSLALSSSLKDEETDDLGKFYETYFKNQNNAPISLWGKN